MRLNIIYGVCLSVFYLLPVELSGQQGSIRGKVTTKGLPLEFVNIHLKGTGIGMATDVNGDYLLPNVPSGEYLLVASMIGYQTFTEKVSIPHLARDIILNIELIEHPGTLDEVVISGTMKEISRLESPVPVEVYSAKFFKADPSPSIFESLQHINGVRPQLNCNVCNTGDIHINGLEGPYTMVLIDGMPIVSGLSTVYGLTGIPQAIIERIEVVKGPASTLYGSEAVGGIINVITKKPSGAPRFAVDIFGTTWGEVNTDLATHFQLTENVDGLAGINYYVYGNPVDNNSDGFTDVTLQDRMSVFNKLVFRRSSGKAFTIAGRYVYEDRWGGEINWESAYRGGDIVYGESIYTSRWETFGLYDLPGKMPLEFRYSANGHHQNSAYGQTRFNADQYIGFGQLTWFGNIGKHDLISGIAYRYTYYDDNTTVTANKNSNQPSVTHLPGIFSQADLHLSKSSRLLLGIRFDYNNLHGSILTPRLNYKWTANDKMTVLRFGVGNGYRVANVFTEDHAALTGAREVEFSEALKPEKSWNGNVNLVRKIYTRGGLFLGMDFTAFYTFFNNRILPDYETDPNKIIYSNLESAAVSRGVSANFDISLENGLSVLAGLTLMDVTIEKEGRRERQLLAERFSANWQVSYSFPQYQLTLAYTSKLYGPMRLPLLGPLDERSEYSPWWSIQNIQITKRWNASWELYGGVKNLLNFTPPANSIARSFDPFDKQVIFDEGGQVVPTPSNPQALTFDPTYVYAPNQGIRGFLGLRYTFQ